MTAIRRSPNGRAMVAMPAIAAKLSWKATLVSTIGWTATMAAAARPSAGKIDRGLPRASAARYTVPMIVARTADGDMPDKRT